MSANADISSDLLFCVPEVLSPRLAWMKRHEVITYHGMSGWYAAFKCHAYDYYFLQETCAHGGSRCGFGNTELEALTDLAVRTKTKLWNEEAP